MTPSGIEPATCRFVVQCLNHYVIARPLITLVLDGISERFTLRPFYPGDRAFGTHHLGALCSSRVGNIFMVFVSVFSFRM